jgi:hypothetical protein
VPLRKLTCFVTTTLQYRTKRLVFAGTVGPVVAGLSPDRPLVREAPFWTFICTARGLRAKTDEGQAAGPRGASAMTVVRSSGVSVEDYYQAPPGAAGPVRVPPLLPKRRRPAPCAQRCAAGRGWSGVAPLLRLTVRTSACDAGYGLAAEGSHYVGARKPHGLAVCFVLALGAWRNRDALARQRARR